MKNSQLSLFFSLEISTDAEPERGTTPHLETAKIYKQPSEDTESTKENNAAFPCWQKGCNKVFTSSSALQHTLQPAP